ncbi:hypothetical protein LJR230_005102 [Trinickia sp. LjRoot230]|uniref:hypothetical protein n=1 Tax=Trinickia sp. LjRoot230 TaxID=3342288 RepID=UPI003ED136C5
MVNPITGTSGVPDDRGMHTPAHGGGKAAPPAATPAGSNPRIAALASGEARATDITFSTGGKPAASTPPIEPGEEVTPQLRAILLPLIGNVRDIDDLRELLRLPRTPGLSRVESQLAGGRKLWLAAQLALQVEHCPSDQHLHALASVADDLNEWGKRDEAVHMPTGWTWKEHAVTQQAMSEMAAKVEHLSTLQMLLGPSDLTHKTALIDHLDEPVRAQMIRHLTPVLSRLPKDEQRAAHQTLSSAIGSLSEEYRAEPERALRDFESEILLPPDSRAAYKLGDELVAQAKEAENLADVKRLTAQIEIVGPPPLRNDTLGAIRLPDGTLALPARERPEPLAELARAIAKKEFAAGDRDAAFTRVLETVGRIDFGHACVAPLSALADVARVTGSQSMGNYRRVLSTAWRLHRDGRITERQLLTVIRRAGEVLQTWRPDGAIGHFRAAAAELSPRAREVMKPHLPPVARIALTESN